MKIYVFQLEDRTYETTDPAEIAELSLLYPYEIVESRGIATWFQIWFFLSITVLMVWGGIILWLLTR
jgi:hypothetical protein